MSHRSLWVPEPWPGSECVDMAWQSRSGISYKVCSLPPCRREKPNAVLNQPEVAALGAPTRATRVCLLQDKLQLAEARCQFLEEKAQEGEVMAARCRALEEQLRPCEARAADALVLSTRCQALEEQLRLSEARAAETSAVSARSSAHEQSQSSQTHAAEVLVLSSRCRALEEQLQFCKARDSSRCSLLEERLQFCETRAEVEVQACRAKWESELTAQKRSSQAAEKRRRSLWEERREKELQGSTIRGVEHLLQQLEEQKNRAYISCEERLSEALAAQSIAADRQLCVRMGKEREAVAEEFEERLAQLRTQFSSELEAERSEQALSLEEVHALRDASITSLQEQLSVARSQAESAHFALETSNRHAMEQQCAIEARLAQDHEQLLAIQQCASRETESCAEAWQRLKAVQEELAADRAQLTAKFAAAQAADEMRAESAIAESAQMESALLVSRSLFVEESVTLDVERSRRKSEEEFARQEAEALKVASESLQEARSERRELALILDHTRNEVLERQEEFVRAEAFARACERRSEVQARWTRWGLERRAEESCPAKLTSVLSSLTYPLPTQKLQCP